jgi:thiosulfate reductase cytochrome b subunit
MAGSESKRFIYRYPILIRAAHWTNVVCLSILLMSGLQIFNAHPALYWGEDSDFDRPILSINAASKEGRIIGVTRIFGRNFNTTGVLGQSKLNGRPAQRAFPAWITIPGPQDLATGRVWHFFFAWLFVINGVAYFGYSVVSRHFSRDLLPHSEHWKNIARALRNHASAQYNVIQRLSYLIVILVIAPLIVLTGLTMSPAINAAWPWFLDIFGGRQSARTIHFVLTWLLVLFVFVHVAMVILSGFLNNLRSMITGWYRTSDEPLPHDSE